MDKNKEFDAVLMMREIREKLSERYWKHPDILKREMQAIREKYNIEIKGNTVSRGVTSQS